MTQTWYNICGAVLAYKIMHILCKYNGGTLQQLLLPPRAPLSNLVPHPVNKVKIWGASPGCEVAVLEVHHGLHLIGLEHVGQLRGVLPTLHR